MNTVPLDLVSGTDLMRHTAQDEQEICILKQKKEKKKGLVFFGRLLANRAPVGLTL